MTSFSTLLSRVPRNRGYIVMYNMLLFVAVSSLLAFGVARPVVASHTATNAFVSSKETFLAANSAVEESLYRLQRGLDLGSTGSVSLDGATADISVADTVDGKTVTVSANVGDYERSVQLVLEQGAGASFNYGLQTGTGGFEMSGGAGVNGNVYANGDIIGSGGPYITGSAVVSNASNPVADQSNGTVFPPSSAVSFGGNTTPQDAAQSFQVSTTTAVTSIRFYVKKSTNNWMNNVTVRITTDNGGKPSKTTVASGTLSATQVTTSYNYLSIPFTNNPSLTPGTTYWIVLDTATTWGSYYSLAASSNTYANGLGKTGTWSSGNGGTWNNTDPSGLDVYFDVYVGGDTGLISGVTVGSGGTGDAWAHEVNNSTVAGTIYCQAASGNNKACDTSRPDPVEQPMPVSDGNILDWKAAAESGGITNGNVSYGGSQQVTLGPRKIVGDLTVGSGATLRITGTLWVTGNISVSGGGIVRLDSSYAGSSGIIVTDGRVSNSGGGQFQGSGTAGSYILVVTTSQCPTGCGTSPAISVSGGTGAVVLNAQQGTIEFSGGAHAKQATGKKIIMGGGTTVTYETGLAHISFSTGPSGAWTVASWEEI